MNSAANWFSRPLSIPQAFQILKEALEEREKFFNIIPSPSYALDIPARFNMNTLSNRDLLCSNLRHRIEVLVQKAFDPRKFGQWSAYSAVGSVNPFFNEMGVDLEGYRYARPEPYRMDDGRFFYAAADILNRCALYPYLAFSSKAYVSGANFGMNADLQVHDILAGKTVSAEYMYNENPLHLILHDGTYAAAYLEYPVRYFRKRNADGNIIREYRISAKNHRFFCQANMASEFAGGTLQMRGSFQVELSMNWRCRLWDSEKSGFSSVSGTKTQICTLCPEKESDIPDLSEWQEQINAASRFDSNAPEEIDEYDTYVRVIFSTPRIFINPENYPVLPYKYLT
ncbi:MAG: hypothetical protein IKA71_02590 [Lentisphaeria bacterium]|nr:hypothetical protein [Lentisphaeria bacterium]